MTEEEYQRRKRHLEEQLRQGTELLQAAFREALELVWLAAADKDVVLPRAASEGSTSPSSQPVTPARPRQKRGQLWKDIDAVLDQLPEVFDRDDLVKALGYEPDRSALHRVMSGLRRQEIITLKAYSVGKIPARWEKNYEVEEDEGVLSAEEEEAKPPAS